MGLQPICGAHFLPALWDTMHSKQYNPPKKHRHGAGHHHFRMGIMPQGQVLQHLSPRCPDGCQGHPDPAAEDTEVSPWLWLSRHYMANISYARKSTAGHPKLALCQLPQFIPARDVTGAMGCHQPAPGSSRGVRAQAGSGSAGPGAGLGTVSCSGARSCAHLDFSRLRSTSLLNQMAKINK